VAPRAGGGAPRGGALGRRVRRGEQHGGGGRRPSPSSPPTTHLHHHGSGATTTDPVSLRLLPHHRAQIRWLATVEGGTTSSLRQIRWYGPALSRQRASSRRAADPAPFLTVSGGSGAATSLAADLGPWWRIRDGEASLAADLGGATGTTRAAADGLDAGSWMGLRLGSSFFIFFIFLTEAGNWSVSVNR
jgi:hypothetical protein